MKTYTINEWLKAIKMSLSDDLLQPKLRKKISKEKLTPEVRQVRGHCYIATEAAYHLFGKNFGYKPECVRCSDGGTHWWLRHYETRNVIDPTIEQTDGKFDYDSGRCYGYRTKIPSKRCAILIDRAKEYLLTRQ